MLTIDFIKAIQRLPASAITINGGYASHYMRHPNQLAMNSLIILSGIATGLLNVPSLLALQFLDHDSRDVAIDAQLPGMIIMGCCSSIAQVNFLLSDLVKHDGSVYKEDHQHLSILEGIHKQLLDQFDLTKLNKEDFEDSTNKVSKALRRQMRQWLSNAIIAKLIEKRQNLDKAVEEIEWPDFEFEKWIQKINKQKTDAADIKIYQLLDQLLEQFKEDYTGILQAVNDALVSALTLDEKTFEQDLKGKIAAANGSLQEKDNAYGDQSDVNQFIIRLYEALNHTPDGVYLYDPEAGSSNERTIKISQQLGVTLSYVNVFVNVLIGIGAFFALGQFIFWIAGAHLAIFMLGGILGWTIKLAFAGLCAVGAYLYTRHNIQSIFNQMGYQLVLWFKDPQKWRTLWHNIKNPQMLFTIFATLPAAIGISMINALGFYLAMSASPAVFALALLIFVSTFIAIVALMGTRMYEAYPRFKYYWHEFKQKIGMFTMNALFTAAVIATIFTTSAHMPLLLAFWSVTPFSTVLLAVFIGVVIFSSIMAMTGEWRLKTAFSAAVGMICVLASIVTVFVALAPLVGPVVAAMVGLTSSILFFSFFVSSIMVDETNEKEYVLMRFFEPNNKPMPGFESASGLHYEGSMFETKDKTPKGMDGLLEDNATLTK